MERNTGDVNVLHELIIKAIHFIRTEKRTRPTVEKIYAYLKKFEPNISEDYFYEHFQAMITQGLIFDKNAEISNKQSFAVNRLSETVSTTYDETVNSPIKDTSVPLVSSVNSKNQSNKKVKLEVPTITHQKLINDYIEKRTNEILIPFTEQIERLIGSYDNVLKEKRIIDAKNKQLTQELTNVKAIEINSKDVITEMTKDIIFLRSECASKNEIIKTLISDKDNFLYPKKVAKTPLNGGFNKLSTSNRYEYLTDEGENSDEHLTHNSNAIKEKSAKTAGNKRNKANQEKHQNQSRFNQKKTRVTTILGDSIIKDVKPHKIRDEIGPEEKVFIKSFSGATIDSMKDYVKPSLKFKSDLYILHAGTNDLRSEKTPEVIADQIVELAKNMKTAENEVMISGITKRRDQYNKKGIVVNKHLRKLCYNENIEFIDNSNISETHLNNSGIHLNFKGTVILGSNLVKSIQY
jgi:hypothetical protein